MEKKTLRKFFISITFRFIPGLKWVYFIVVQIKIPKNKCTITVRLQNHKNVNIIRDRIFLHLEVSGPAFEEFLDILGQRVRLKGFDKYKGGLDNRGDTTGQYSIYTTHQQYEIMFHVSTMLPFTPSNKQQVIFFG